MKGGYCLYTPLPRLFGVTIEKSHSYLISMYISAYCVLRRYMLINYPEFLSF